MWEKDVTTTSVSICSARLAVRHILDQFTHGSRVQKQRLNKQMAKFALLLRVSDAAFAAQTPGKAFYGDGDLSKQAERRVGELAVRVAFFDKLVLDSLQPATAESASPNHQVVVLGSGLDTRPWRLSFPSAVRYVQPSAMCNTPRAFEG